MASPTIGATIKGLWREFTNGPQMRFQLRRNSRKRSLTRFFRPVGVTWGRGVRHPSLVWFD
jgi:hypothetical protein